MRSGAHVPKRDAMLDQSPSPFDVVQLRFCAEEPPHDLPEYVLRLSVVLLPLK